MLSIGGPIVISLCLLILGGSHYDNTGSASDIHKLEYTWRVLMAIGILIPLSVFYFRRVLPLEYQVWLTRSAGSR